MITDLKVKQIKKSADFKRKIEKGGVFEAFERKITGRQEDTNIRPDHGRHIWDEKCRPGYGLYDRALGVMYILGVWDALEKFDRK